MAVDVETTIRGPQAYSLAGRALQLMQDAQVWPTPLNYELWIHYARNPEGKLGRAIEDLLEYKTPITEAVSEQLAADHLPRGGLKDQIAEASEALSRELAAVGHAVETAQRNQAAYGMTLVGAGQGLDGADAPAFKALVETLTVATKKVQTHSKTLEKRLADSTSEMDVLRNRLEEARRDATTDGLTQLSNRKSFDAHFARLRELTAGGKGGPLTLALLDIDHFKKFNDTWGHQTGDQVLRFVASVLARHGKSPRFTARYGGEEFAILFAGEQPLQVMHALNLIREEIASRVLKRRSTNEDLGAVTISMGVATMRAGEKTAALTERADAALYSSKRNGRNRVTNADYLPAAA